MTTTRNLFRVMSELHVTAEAWDRTWEDEGGLIAAGEVGGLLAASEAREAVAVIEHHGWTPVALRDEVVRRTSDRWLHFSTVGDIIHKAMDAVEAA